MEDVEPRSRDDMSLRHESDSGGFGIDDPLITGQLCKSNQMCNL